MEGGREGARERERGRGGGGGRREKNSGSDLAVVNARGLASSFYWCDQWHGFGITRRGRGDLSRICTVAA